jgi:putative ABC transport system permease protein
MGIRVQDAGEALASIGEKWESLFPAYPFDYFFQEDYYDNMYKEDRNMGNLFIYFTILAILISVLGLFGLVLFTASRRVREIGIRKALGGDTHGLVLMLLREYPVLILLASALALPASWYFARQWLANFAEKTDISSWIYVISVFLVLMVCLGTTIIQTLRTARANPANALRYE